jgi:hypothetical protein
MQKLSIYEMNLKFLVLGSEPKVIPKDHSFLKKYFKTKVQRQFLYYYYYFHDWKNFTNHTGIRADRSFLNKLCNKFEWILGEYTKARKNLDLKRMGAIQMRQIRLLKKFS